MLWNIGPTITCITGPSYQYIPIEESKNVKDNFVSQKFIL